MSAMLLSPGVIFHCLFALLYKFNQTALTELDSNIPQKSKALFRACVLLLLILLGFLFYQTKSKKREVLFDGRR